MGGGSILWLQKLKNCSRFAGMCARRLSIPSRLQGPGIRAGSLSEVEILVALYFRIMNIDPREPNKPDRDRFILSKGHCTPGYYCALANRGYFKEEVLGSFDAIDSILQGHPCMVKTPGVDMSTGSLGQGLSAGLGMCLGRDRRGLNFNVYVSRWRW